MKIIKCVSVLALSAAIVGCSAELREFELDGVSGRFCVPNAHLVMDVPWLDGVVAESSRAIGFTGCWNARGEMAASCGFPPEVRTGVVFLKKDFRGRRWEEIAEDTWIRQVLLADSSTFESVGYDGLVVVQRAGVHSEWYVWKKVDSNAKPDSVRISEGDELLAICRPGNAFVGKTERKFTDCNRRVMGDEYAVEYSFEVSGRVPRGLEQLDADVFKRIESWRCPAKR